MNTNTFDDHPRVESQYVESLDGRFGGRSGPGVPWYGPIRAGLSDALARLTEVSGKSGQRLQVKCGTLRDLALNRDLFDS